VITTKEFLKICDYRNLEKAAKIARKNKIHISGQEEFFSNFEENIISLQNELIWRLYFPHMPIPAFKDIVVQIALFNSLKNDPDLIRDFNVFALLENIVFSKIVQSDQEIIRLLNPATSRRRKRRDVKLHT
jgi:hypothetical protein